MRFRKSKSDDGRVRSAGLLLTKRSVFLCDPCKAVLNGSGKELQLGAGSWALGRVTTDGAPRQIGYVPIQKSTIRSAGKTSCWHEYGDSMAGLGRAGAMIWTVTRDP
jgi:hypothetical protein